MSNPFENIAELYEEQVEKADESGNANLFKQVTDNCMTWIRKAGFTPTNIKYLDGYYIFGFGTNSVIHYEIKECPEWYFAIWWNYNDEKPNYITGEFFCEHKQNMNKFKPSQTEICYTIDIYKSDLDKNDIAWGFEYKWINTLKFIHKHPCRAFYRTYHGTDFNIEYVPGIVCFINYIKFKVYELNRNTWNKWFEKSEIRFIKKYVLPFCDYDSEHKAELIYMGDNWSPMYDIQCKIPDGANEEETGCFGIFDEDLLTDEGLAEGRKVKAKWDRLVKHHEKISDIFHFWADRICDDTVTFWRQCDQDEVTNND